MGKLEQWTVGVTRYYQSVVNDDFKHHCIQYLIGEHPKLKPYGIRGVLDKELQKHKKMFTTQKELNLSVLTWNCGGNPPPYNMDITSECFPADRPRSK